MEGIYIAAGLATALSLGVWITPLLWRVERAQALRVVVALGCELPMCALAFFLVRRPLMELVSFCFGAGSTAAQAFVPFWAPLTEEPAKLLPLLIPWLRRGLGRNDRIGLGMALGLGFGLGEIWFVVTESVGGEAAGLPWYLFGGLIMERFVVCLCHGAFTTMAVWSLGRRLWRGLLLAMAMHFLLNFPIFLGALDVGGLGQGWQVVLQVWILLAFVFCGALLFSLRFARRPEEAEEGQRPRFALWHVLNGTLALSFCFPAGIPGLVLSLIAQGEWSQGKIEQGLARLRLAKLLFGVGLALGLATATATLAWFVSSIPPPPPVVELTGDEREALLAEAEPIAARLLEGFDEGDYARFSADLDDDMRRALPPERFDSARQELLSRFGRVRARSVRRVERRGELTAVIYDAEFERPGASTVRVVFRRVDGALRVAGHFVR